MFRRPFIRMGESAKNSINSSIKGEGNLTKNRSSKPFSEAAQRNKGEGITPTKPSEQNNTPSNLEKLRRFHRYKLESNPQDSILYAKPGDPAYPGSPAAFDPRLTSSPETPETLPKELSRLVQEGKIPPGVVRPS